MIVPPVPTVETSTSTWPPVSSQISGPVVAWWTAGVGRVAALTGEEGARRALEDAPGLLVGAGHRERTGGQDDLGPEGAQQGAALVGDVVGHADDDPVAEGRADPGQGDAGVPAGRLEDGPARLQASVGLGGADDRERCTVLDARRRVEELELAEHRRVGEQLGQAHEGGTAHELGRAVVHVRELRGHRGPLVGAVHGAGSGCRRGSRLTASLLRWQSS